MSSEVFTFFRELFEKGIPAGQHLLIVTITGEKLETHAFKNIEGAVDFVEGSNAPNIYFQLGLAPRDPGRHKRCTAEEVSALPGLVCDIDIFAKGVHEKPGLPASDADALRILPQQFPPTMIWSTGHGLQAGWWFKDLESLTFTSDQDRDGAAARSQRWHRYIAGDAKRLLGYAMDSTFSLEHLFRVPGTTNGKRPDDLRPVCIIQNSGRRYNPTDIDSILDSIGVPEVEIKHDDGRGNVEYGDLTVSPKVELDPETIEKLDANKDIDPDFKDTWDRKRRMPRDSSWTGFALSIAGSLAIWGFSDQQIIDILTVHRREHGDVGKRGPKTLRWFKKYAIAPARKWAAEEKERKRKKAEADAKRKEAAEREVQEKADIAEVRAGGPEEARAKLRAWLELPVDRLIQVGEDTDPSYKLVLKHDDGVEQVVEIPSLSIVNSFAAVDRYVWRYTRTPLPPKARKKWRQIREALGQVIQVEETGLGKVELMLSDLGEFFASARHELFEHYPADEHPDGPPANGGSYNGWCGWLVRAVGEAELNVALSLLAQPRRSARAIPGVYYLDKQDAEVAEALFAGPPLFDWLRRTHDRKFDIDEMNHRLFDAGFRYKETTIIGNHRLRRIWRGKIADACADDHEYLRAQEIGATQDLAVRLAKETIQ